MADIVETLMNGCLCFDDPPAAGMTHLVDEIATDRAMEEGAKEIILLREVINSAFEDMRDGDDSSAFATLLNAAGGFGGEDK